MKKILLALLFAFTLTGATAFADIVPTVNRSSSRARVAEVQDALNQCSDARLTVDGVWGSRTTTAVRRFQIENGISPVGFVGLRTSQALNDCVESGGLNDQDDDTPLVGSNSTSASALCPNGMTVVSSCTLPLNNTSTIPTTLCPNGMTIISNCSVLPSNPVVTNGPLCPNGYLLANNCTSIGLGNPVLLGTEGSLVAINKLGSYNNTTVLEGDRDTRVLGIEMIARDADQKIEGFVVSFNNSNNSSNKKITRYVSEISIWLDGVEIGRKAAYLYSDENNDTYTYRFTGMNGVVRRDQRSQLIVAVTASNSIDTPDANNSSWSVSAGTSISGSGDGNFISALSGNGRYRDYGYDNSGSQFTSTVDFQKAGGSSSSQRFRVNPAPNNPNAQVVPVSNTSPTNNVLLLAFEAKAESGSMRVHRLPVTVTVTGNGTGVVPNVEAITGSLKLYANGQLLSDVSVNLGSSTQTVLFGAYGKMDYIINANQTVRFEVRADINDTEPGTGNASTEFDAGDMIRVDYTAVNRDASVIELDNYNGDTVYNRSGSVIGQDQILRSNGATVVMGNATVSYTASHYAGDTSNKAIYTIPVAVTAFDDTVYIGQSVQSAVAGAISGTNGFSFTLNDSINQSIQRTTTVVSNAECIGVSTPYSWCTGVGTGTAPSYGVITTTISSNATTVGSGWILSPGQTRTFIIQIIISGATAPQNYRIQLNDLKFFTDSNLSQNPTVQGLVPMAGFQTPYSPVF